NEKILSAIVEFKTRIEHVPAVLRRIEEVSKTLDTVVAVGVSTRCGEKGESALDEVLAEEGLALGSGKNKLGLGGTRRTLCIATDQRIVLMTTSSSSLFPRGISMTRMPLRRSADFWRSLASTTL